MEAEDVEVEENVEISAGRTRVYKYGLLAPTVNTKIVEAQMRLAHNYRNTLVEIERGRRNAQRSVLAKFDLSGKEQAVLATRAELEAALLAVRVARAASRSRSETEDMRDRVKAARKSHKESTKALAIERKALRADTQVQLEIDVINDRAAELRRSARAFSGLGEMGPHFGAWGTYLLIEAADMAARKAPFFKDSEPNDPRFVRFEGEGQVSVQLQGGMSVEDLFSGFHARARVDAVNENAWFAKKRGDRRRASRTMLSLRVASEGRDPVWATWPMIMHRPIPEGASIQRITVSRRKYGPREEWSVDFTLKLSDKTPARTKCGQSGVVTIDLGWRTIGNEIRVAAWRDDQGKHGELRLDARAVSGLKKPDELRSLRDEKFNFARAALIEILGKVTIPDWLREEISHIAQWRSQARLAALARKWSDRHFEGDDEAYAMIETWRYRDHHLWEYESGQRIGSLRHRREIYRRFAAELGRKYKTLLLEDFDLRGVATRAPTEEGAENLVARRNRQLAAVSELRGCLCNVFGEDALKVSPENSTHICNACGAVEEFDAALKIDHTCSACGATWDQDDNATIVLFERWRAAKKAEAARAAENPKDANVVRESRWVRAKRMKEAKIERQNAARNKDPKDEE